MVLSSFINGAPAANESSLRHEHNCNDDDDQAPKRAPDLSTVYSKMFLPACGS
jgi:hypothetical protein